MPNVPARKDPQKAREADEIETTVIEHTVTTITDAYVAPDGDRLILRKLRPGEQALTVNEIGLTRDAAVRLVELLHKFLGPKLAEHAPVPRPIATAREPLVASRDPFAIPREPLASSREPIAPVPDIIARFLRQEEEEAALARASQAKEKVRNEAETDQRGNGIVPEKPAKNAAESPYESRGKTFS